MFQKKEGRCFDKRHEYFDGYQGRSEARPAVKQLDLEDEETVSKKMNMAGWYTRYPCYNMLVSVVK